MATSGLAFAIHSFDFSKPEKTRCQYGSSVCLLSIAAPIAGTCDDATPAMILATFRPRFAARFDLDFDLPGFDPLDFDLAAWRVSSLPDLLRLPSTERPPPSIMAA